MGYKRTNTQDSSVRMSVGKKLLFGITVPIIAILLILALVVTTPSSKHHLCSAQPGYQQSDLFRFKHDSYLF